MQKPTHRVAWLSLAIVLAACGAVCALLSCTGAIAFLLSYTMSDVGHSSWFWALLTYPAYAFGKWSRAAWRAGAGIPRDWLVALVVMAAVVVLFVALFEWLTAPACRSWVLRDGTARIVGFAFLVAYFFFSWVALRRSRG